MWADLHEWALLGDIADTSNWLNKFQARIGCGECVRHWQSWIQEHPPDASNNDALFAWSVAAHNAVNRRLGKAEVDIESARRIWKTKAGHHEAMGGTEDLRAPIRKVNCAHASPCQTPNTVVCALGLFRGRPHMAMCQDCGKRQPEKTVLPALIMTPRFQSTRIPAPMEPADKDGWLRRTSGAAERVVFRSHLSPGDVLMLTAAVRDLHRAYPGRFATAVETTAQELWENNPHIVPVQMVDPSWRRIETHYPLIQESNQRPVHFLDGYVQYLSALLKASFRLTEFRGDIHLSESEKSWTNQVKQTFGYSGRFWIIVAGGKYDFTAKWWPPKFYQAVVDHFMGRLQFVQCGQQGHWHPPLRGVFNLVGKTSIRQLIRLVYHSDGIVCPVTFAMHLAAAVPTTSGRLRPCVVIAGGREPPHWEAYPGHQFLHTIGTLPCCATGGCWKSRCQTVGDGDSKDRHGLCDLPVVVEEDLRVPQCMVMIHPTDVIRAIERALAYRPIDVIRASAERPLVPPVDSTTAAEAS